MLLGLAFSLGVASGPRLGLAYATLVLGGWASLTIVGMLLKIVPFLVWYRQYAGLAGRVPVPTLGQLSTRRGERLAYLLLTGGRIALVAGLARGEVTVIRAAGVAVSSGALVFVGTLARVLGHLLPYGPHFRSDLRSRPRKISGGPTSSVRRNSALSRCLRDLRTRRTILRH